MNMDGKRFAWLLPVGTAIAAVLAALSAHGKAAVDALAGVPLLLQAWASGLPLGIWSFALALLLSVLVWAKVITLLPRTTAGRSAHFASDTVALLTALAVAVTQQTLADGSPGGLVSALWIGLIAGLLAPYIGRGLRTILSPNPPEKKPATPAAPPPEKKP